MINNIDKIKKIIEDTDKARNGTICKYIRHIQKNHELLIVEIKQLIKEIEK